MKERITSLVGVIKSNKAKLIRLGIIVAVLIAIVGVIFFKGYSNAEKKYQEKIAELEQEVDRLSQPIATYEEATTEVSISMIKAQINTIGELATIEFLYTDAGKFENTKQWGKLNLPFTTKHFIAKWDGNIKAGVKIDQIDVDVDKENKEIIIHMPKAEILSHEIDEGSVETLDEKAGLFNPLEVEDVRVFDAESKEAMENRAIENGILDKAHENAKVIIENLVNNDVVKEQGYTIKFEVNE